MSPKLNYSYLIFIMQCSGDCKPFFWRPMSALSCLMFMHRVMYPACRFFRIIFLWRWIPMWVRLFVSVVTLMRSVVWRSVVVWVCCVDRQGSLTLISLLMVFYWLIFLSVVATLLGIAGMGDLWAASIGFCFLKSGVWPGLVVFIRLRQGGVRSLPPTVIYWCGKLGA